MRILIIITVLLIAKNILAQESTIGDSLLNSDDAYRFFGIDYKAGLPQTPTSKKYNLKGLDVRFTSLNIDFAYPWYLDKKKENSILFAKILYSNTTSNSSINNQEYERFNSDIPSYIYQKTSYHNMGLSLLFNQQLKQNWNISIATEFIYASDLKASLKMPELNFTSYIFINKKLGAYTLGGGVAIYYINGKISTFPLFVIDYSSKKLNIEFAPPLSIKTDYKLTKKSTLGFEAALTLTGINIDYNNITQNDLSRPDFINSNALDFAINFDRRFYETFHYKISTGFTFQEISYQEKEIILDEVILDDGLFLEISFYSTF